MQFNMPTFNVKFGQTAGTPQNARPQNAAPATFNSPQQAPALHFSADTFESFKSQRKGSPVNEP